ncbi:hypothetical protein SDJN02_08070, partial [Cucurbita argyrosperma subsp. argyrosperma]
MDQVSPAEGFVEAIEDLVSRRKSACHDSETFYPMPQSTVSFSQQPPNQPINPLKNLLYGCKPHLVPHLILHCIEQSDPSRTFRFERFTFTISSTCSVSHSHVVAAKFLASLFAKTTALSRRKLRLSVTPWEWVLPEGCTIQFR